MKLSSAGLAFLCRHEGMVSRAYRDIGGVWTIGSGLTMGSAVVAEYWRKTRGHRLRAGDTIDATENALLLRRVVDHEFGAAVDTAIPGLVQHQFDAATSACFNLGVGALAWRWAMALKAGEPARAAALLRAGYATVNGKRVAGLVQRRQAEAALLEHGTYDTAAATAKPDPVVATVQRQLAKLGFAPGAPDGLRGPRTIAAIRSFQASHPDLKVDGVAGPATRSQLARLLHLLPETAPVAVAGGAVGALGGALAASATQLDPLATGLTAAIPGALAAAASPLWRHRTELALLWRQRGRLRGWWRRRKSRRQRD